MEIPFNNADEKAIKQPVIVFGLTFANDDERRTHFRNELRKHLPELKKIEGFPIGDDEDIVNLSDPPYYTACPNPWLNNFIGEWEAEKVDLEAQGKRVEDFEVDAPYATDVSEGKNNPIYNAHSYHTKVPHPAIMRYILHYTQPGDIVFDGFAGTGMTGVAAGMCGNPDALVKNKIEAEFRDNGLGKPLWGQRRAICGDLSPIASFISYNYNAPIDVSLFVEYAKEIAGKVEKEWGWMFETKDKFGNIGKINFTIWSDVFICPNCGGDIVFYDVAVDHEAKEVKDEFVCPTCKTKLTKKETKNAFITVFDNCLKKIIHQVKTVPVLINFTWKGKRFEKTPDVYDLELLKKIEECNPNVWYPSLMIPYGDKTSDPRNKGVTHVHHFHIKSNLIGLSTFWDFTSKDRIGNGLKLAISAANPNFSKMRRYRPDGKGGGPLAGTLYIASIITPQNCIKSILRNVEYIQKAFNLIVSSNIDNCAVFTNSCTQVLQKENSVDYIFTDPPFGSNLMYSELNVLWESWLKVLTNNETEAIENKTQGKGLLDYQNIILRCFVEYFRILKPGKWMTVEFSNTSAAVWNGIQTAIQRAGFIIANVSALDKKQGGFNSVNNAISVKQDLVISCYKPSTEFDTKFQHSQHSEVGIWDFISEHLQHLPVHVVKENATTAVIERSPKILFDRLIAFYVQRNLPVPIDAALFQKGLRERFIERDGMFFTAEQVHVYDTKKAEVPRFVQLSLLVGSEQEGVAWLRRELETPQTYQELHSKWMQALAGSRKGDIIPELRDILEDNYLQNEAGAWYIPDMENEIDLEKVRTRRLLKQFDTYREQAYKPKGKIKEARVEALRTGFKQCYKDKDFKTIVLVGDNIPNNLLMEDEVLLQYYDIAVSRA